MPATLKKLLTVEEFSARYTGVPLRELVRGKVVKLMPGAGAHGLTAANVVGILGTWAKRTRRGRVLSNEAGIITERSPGTVRGADCVYISFAWLPRGKMPDTFLSVPPELIAEVVGKGQTWGRLQDKASEYLRMGVDRVWILDPKSRTLHVFSSDDPPHRYRRNATISDETILPGFSCKVGEFFEE